MANICEYKVIVKGKKNACYAFYGSTSNFGGKEIDHGEGTDDDYTLYYNGDCKWSIDSYCSPFKGEKPVQLPENFEEAEEAGENLYWYNTVQERSEMFQVEVQCCSADIEDYDEDGPYNIYEHYINGKACKDNYADFEDIPEELRIYDPFREEDD